jgi:hypothetical protein
MVLFQIENVNAAAAIAAEAAAIHAGAFTVDHFGFRI